MGKSPPIGVGLPKTNDLPCFLTLLVHSLSVPPAGGGVSPCLRSGHHAPNARLSARTATRKAMLRMARLPPQRISHLTAECLPCFSCGQMTFNERRLCGRNLLMLDISWLVPVHEIWTIYECAISLIQHWWIHTFLALLHADIKRPLMSEGLLHEGLLNC